MSQWQWKESLQGNELLDGNSANFDFLASIFLRLQLVGYAKGFMAHVCNMILFTYN